MMKLYQSATHRWPSGPTSAATGENHSSEPTYTSNTEVMEVPLNHRATYRWVAKDGSEIVCPATSGDGIGIHSLHASATTDFRAGAWWEE